MEEFDATEILSQDVKNEVSTYALSAVVSYGFDNLSKEVTLSLLSKTASVVFLEREGKGLNVYYFIESLKETDPSKYSSFSAAFSTFPTLKEELKSKLNNVAVSDADKENYSVILTAIVFGYSVVYSTVEDFWLSFDENQKQLHPAELLSKANLISIFDSDYTQMRLNLLNSLDSEISVVSLLKYAYVGHLFSGTPINTELMKDSEIQSYRISGKVNYFYNFDPLIVDCEQIEVDGVTGFRAYPCNRVSVKPRDLQFNQIITDGPYSSGGSSVADAGIALLASIKNSSYDFSRLESVKILNENSSFASYNSGWIFDEFSGKRLVNLRGDVAFANNADSFKSFPDGAETGQYHFLGSYTFATGTGVGQIFKHSGFAPILLRLNDTDEQRIYSQLELNLFDKQKRSGQLMAYTVSTDNNILSSFSSGDSSQYPLLSIANSSPSIPFVGINLEFSSKTFNKLPAAKFNFGSLYFVPATKLNHGGSFTTATDFSFSGFDMSGDSFELSKGSIKFNKEIKNTENFNPEEALVNERDEFGLLISTQPGKMLLQKALGFSNYEDCITGVEGVKTDLYYGVEYRYITGLTPPEIEDEENKHVKRIGDTGVLKYVTGPLLSKRVFGPLDSKTDQGLDGKDFDYKYLPENYGELSYAHVPALNPARYYSGLFASERRQFLYPNASSIHRKNNNRYFPSQVKLSFKVEEEYSKSANGSLSRYGGNVQKTIGELSDYWVDQDFSHNNTVDVGLFSSSPVWSYNPLTSRNLNPHHQYLTGDVSILDGELVSGSLTTYSFATELGYGRANLSLPSTPITSAVKKEYSAELEMNYTLPEKSLSDFTYHPEYSNKSFVSTGASEIELVSGASTTTGGWNQKVNEDVNPGKDPLFQTSLDSNENISGDSWNAFYLRSGSVFYPVGGGSPPYRDQSKDKILIEASENSSNLRLLLRNLELFPTFVNNEQDINYESGSLTSSHFSSQRQKNNFSDVSLRVFEINAGSIFDKIPNDDTAEEVSSFIKNISLNIAVEKNILRTGKLYYTPELIDQSVTLPEVSEKEYKQISDLYPQLIDYAFYSGVDSYSRMNSGYFIQYEESSNLKLTITSAEVKYDRFPASDELFEFHITGKAAFSGELSYVTQEEPCVVTHGIKIEEQVNDLDKFQAEYRFSSASPVLKEKLGSISTFSFPTSQVRRRNKIISGQNTFVSVNSSSPDYNNHLYVSIVPEYVYFAGESSILGSFSPDHLWYPNGSIINSSSYDYLDIFPDGTEYRMEKIDKIYEVVESNRFYDSYFTDSLLHPEKFIESLPTGDLFNSNKECKSFFGANFSKISDLELGEEGNLYITKMEDRSSDVSKLRPNMLTGA